MGAPETTIYEAVVIACLVMGVIIVYFFISVIRHQRENLALRKKSILSEISGLEKERARIASDLHDELGPLLSAVKMKINSFELSGQEDRQQLEKTNIHIDDVLKRMREISFDLIPNTLLKKGLVTALVEYVDFLNSENNIQFTFLNETDCLIHGDKSVNIYRIVQEVTHNAVKHARATEIRIELRNKNNKIHLAVSDNGIGFDYKKALAENAGIGLNSLSNRTQIAGGRMFLESSENGTRYIFEIPI
jgi:two-component system, NarL family, sensor kinase